MVPFPQPTDLEHLGLLPLVADAELRVLFLEDLKRQATLKTLNSSTTKPRGLGPSLHSALLPLVLPKHLGPRFGSTAWRCRGYHALSELEVLQPSDNSDSSNHELQILSSSKPNADASDSFQDCQCCDLLLPIRYTVALTSICFSHKIQRDSAHGRAFGK